MPLVSYLCDIFLALYPIDALKFASCGCCHLWHVECSYAIRAVLFHPCAAKIALDNNDLHVHDHCHDVVK